MLASSTAFAAAIQRSLVLAVQLYQSVLMSKDPKWDYIKDSVALPPPGWDPAEESDLEDLIREEETLLEAELAAEEAAEEKRIAEVS